MPESPAQNQTTQNQTARNLIDAGLHLFADKGYEATSTREIAAQAQTNVASIAYHFGGKAGLRAACAHRVAETVSRVFAAIGAPDANLTPQQAQQQIEMLLTGFVQLVIGTPKAQDMVTFVVRELAHPGDVASSLYAEMLEPRHKAVCALWARATGRAAEDEAIKLAVFATVGQVIYFRIAQPFVQQRMGWQGMTQTETQKITETVIAALRDTLERLRT